MVEVGSDEIIKPVVKGVSYFLAHVPSMIRHGSKPSREIAQNPALLSSLLSHIWSFEKAVVSSEPGFYR